MTGRGAGSGGVPRAGARPGVRLRRSRPGASAGHVTGAGTAGRGYRGGEGRETPLLIADEPTAALDARAEHTFFSSLHAHAGRTGAAVVLITHRLASVRMADRIVVLRRGRVVEEGTHAELIGQDGLYRELWDLQAGAYQVPTGS